MPWNAKDYHRNWKWVVSAVKERAGHCCEKCGVQNYSLILRNERGIIVDLIPFDTFKEATAARRQINRDSLLTGDVYTVVVLTTAHLPGRHKTDIRPSSLWSLCNRCHLVMDADLHRRNAAKTRRRKQIEVSGQLELIHLTTA